jgi:hypothetical protein
MPADLLLLDLRDFMKDFLFEGLDEFWILAADFLNSVGRPHPDDLILMTQALEQLGKITRISQDIRYDLLYPADGTAISAGEFCDDFPHRYLPANTILES